MTKITVGPEMLEKFRQARAEGKKLTPLMEQALAEVEGRWEQKGSKTKLAAALYLLGASQRTIAAAMDLRRTTVAGYVREHIPDELRKQATGQRDYGRSGPLLGIDKVEEYLAEFGRRRGEMEGLDAVRIAARLQMYLKPQPANEVESLEDPTDEPY